MKKSGYAKTENGLQEMRRVVTTGKDGKNYVRVSGQRQEVVLFEDLGTWLSKEFASKIQLLQTKAE